MIWNRVCFFILFGPQDVSKIDGIIWPDLKNYVLIAKIDCVIRVLNFNNNNNIIAGKILKNEVLSEQNCPVDISTNIFEIFRKWKDWKKMVLHIRLLSIKFFIVKLHLCWRVMVIYSKILRFSLYFSYFINYKTKSWLLNWTHAKNTLKL